MTKIDLDAVEARARRAVAYDNGEAGMRRLLVDHGNALADVSALCAEVRALRERAAVLEGEIRDARSPCCNAAVRCGRCGSDMRYTVPT